MIKKLLNYHFTIYRLRLLVKHQFSDTKAILMLMRVLQSQYKRLILNLSELFRKKVIKIAPVKKSNEDSPQEIQEVVFKTNFYKKNYIFVKENFKEGINKYGIL